MLVKRGEASSENVHTMRRGTRRNGVQRLIWRSVSRATNVTLLQTGSAANSSSAGPAEGQVRSRSSFIVRLSLLVCLCMALPGGCGQEGNGGGAAPSVTTIVVWQPWGGGEAAALAEATAEFERTHPAIRVKLSYAANNLTSNQKLFLAIAGGTAPDVTFVDGQQLSEWAARGALADLTEMASRAGVTASDFFAPRWNESTYRGRMYALPWGADPNFGLVWNKRLFREAGLDPDRPPRTTQELDEYNRRLTRTDTRGRIVQVGLVPWEWGGANSLFTWGYAFGGRFYEPPSEKNPAGQVTADHPRVVDALRWITSSPLNVRSVAAYQSGFVGISNDPFYLEQSAMRLMHVSQMHYVKLYAPGLEYGIGFPPSPAGEDYPSAWIGGWSLAVPRGREVTPAAFEYMRWLAATPEGTHAMSSRTRQLTAYRHNPYHAIAQSDPDQAVFYELLLNAKHTRSLMPAQGYLMNLLDRALHEVQYGGKDPAAVLQDVTRRAQERLENVHAVVLRREQGAEVEE